MSRYKKELIGRFEELKCKSPFETLQCLPVYDTSMIFRGYLRPITQDYRITLPGCAALLSQWRNDNNFMSPDKFVSTPESTEKWLDHAVLERSDRILFLILTDDGKKVGHIGFSSYDDKDRSVEIDAVMRGDKNTAPGIMSMAMNTLIRWGLDELKMKKIKLRVLSDNTQAIRFYKRNCFYKTGEIPLYQVIGEERWTPQKQNEDQMPEKFYFKMQLDTEQWRKQALRSR